MEPTSPEATVETWGGAKVDFGNVFRLAEIKVQIWYSHLSLKLEIKSKVVITRALQERRERREVR